MKVPKLFPSLLRSLPRAAAVLLVTAVPFAHGQTEPPPALIDVAVIEKPRVTAAAERYLSEEPQTITAFTSTKSSGGVHDYFSEGDYWWPDPQHPDGPYIQKDGMSNPDNFVAHRKALMKFSIQMPALVAAFALTNDQRYATHALKHLHAWFIDESTRMAPHLRFAQAIKGRFTGRGTGIIDTIHLVEVARATEILDQMGALPAPDKEAVLHWFNDYLTWMTTDQYGKDEREAKNNHGTCWVMQVAEFAQLTGRKDLTEYCRDRFKTVMLSNQVATDGSMPLEMKRTKPYGYSLFNLDALATCCHILSTPPDNLWTFTTPDGRSMEKVVAYMFPVIKDKSKWQLPKDVMYDEYWPVRQPSLLFAGLALKNSDYLELWKKLPADSDVDEVNRNWPIRQPVLWTR